MKLLYVYSSPTGDKWNCRETSNKKSKKGTSSVLLQSGLDEQWWAESMDTPQERRFEEQFRCPFIPFGANAEYHPISAKDHSRLHQSGKKVFSDISVCHALCPERSWKGDHFVADVQELQENDASEVYLRRTKTKELLVLLQGDNFISPCLSGSAKLAGKVSEV